jgi:hypothetical protein
VVPVEVYSVKSVSREKKLFKTLDQAYSLDAAEQEEMMLSLSPEMRTAAGGRALGGGKEASSLAAGASGAGPSGGVEDKANR